MKSISKNLKKAAGIMPTTDTPVLAWKRVNFMLSDEAFRELASLSRQRMRSMTEIIRLGLGLVKLALEAEVNGQRIVVTTAEGQPVKEIVLP
jgi:hypothetical protein